MNYKVNEALLEILRTFSKNDIKNFRKFMKSPYLNPYPKVILLFTAIMEYYPDFRSTSISRKGLFHKMDKKNNFNDSTMRDLISKLKLVLDKFLAISGFEGSEFDYLTHLRKQLYNRKLYKQVEKNISEAESVIPGYNEADSDYFFKRIKIETDKFNNYVINRNLYNEQNLNYSINSLNISAKNQLAFFILETIKQNDTILKITKRQGKPKIKNIIPELLEPMDLKEIMVALKRNESEISHIFEIYYNLYMLFTKRNHEKYFHLFKKNIIEYSEMINTDELHFLFGRLIDYCVNNCNEGKAEYYVELFNAYGIMLRKRYYTNSSNKYISLDLFRNIFQTSIRINNLSWAEDFINKYIKELHPQNRDSMYNYCYAYIYFGKGMFERSLEHILKIKQDYFALKIDIKILHLKINYEVGMYEQIYNQLDSFKHFISNHELILPSKREKIREFILLYEKVLKARLNDDSESLIFINKELNTKRDKQFFGWLIDKTGQIK